MDRPSRIELLMEHAQIVAKRGTCSRLQVGALVHRDGRIVVTGYNGAPAGLPHCDHTCDCNPWWQLDEHCVIKHKYGDEDWRPGPTPKTHEHLWHDEGCVSQIPCTTSQHAERNCIDFAARYGITMKYGIMVTTDTPCAQCAGSIINAGIHQVVALREYRDPTGSEMLAAGGVDLLLYRDLI